MRVISLEVESFRNLKPQKIQFDKKLNILTGENAQGKTNALEAICLCALGKSPRTDKDRELIQIGEKLGRVSIEYESQFGTATIDFSIMSGKRRIAVNSVPIMKTGDLMGYFNAVWFSPDELRLVKEGPAERRRFMDIDICQTDRTYLDTLSRFNKALAQRNNILRESLPAVIDDTIGIWDSVLAKEGAKLIKKRRDFVLKLAPEAAELHGRLSGNKERLIVSYITQIAGESLGELTESYTSLLTKNRGKDVSARFTTVGAQRDDVKLSFGGAENSIDVRVYGSRGQQRTTALALKLAETQIMKEATGDTPVLLLDDVLSELDELRQGRLLSLGGELQIILTTAVLPQSLRGRTFTVSDGIISPTNI